MKIVTQILEPTQAPEGGQYRQETLWEGATRHHENKDEEDEDEGQGYSNLGAHSSS